MKNYFIPCLIVLFFVVYNTPYAQQKISKPFAKVVFDKYGNISVSAIDSDSIVKHGESHQNRNPEIKELSKGYQKRLEALNSIKKSVFSKTSDEVDENISVEYFNRIKNLNSNSTPKRSYEQMVAEFFEKQKSALINSEAELFYLYGCYWQRYYGEKEYFLSPSTKDIREYKKRISAKDDRNTKIKKSNLKIIKVKITPKALTLLAEMGVKIPDFIYDYVLVRLPIIDVERLKENIVEFVYLDNYGVNKDDFLQLEEKNRATIWSEGWEGSLAPYVRGDSNPGAGTDFWGDISCDSYAGSWSLWCADDGDQPECSNYDDNMAAYVGTLAGINVSAYTNVKRRYAIKYDTETDYDAVEEWYSGDGANWSLYLSYTGNSGGWIVTPQVTLTGFTNYFWEFDFNSDVSVHSYVGAYLDNMEITGDGGYAVNLNIYSGTGSATTYNYNTSSHLLSSTVSVINEGPGNISSSFDIGWYLSTNTAITTTDYLIGFVSQSGLSANSYVNKSLSVDLDNVSVLPTTSATYYLGFIFDDLNIIPESNENDNSYYFTASAITYPDPITTVNLNTYSGTGSVNTYNYSTSSHLLLSVVSVINEGPGNITNSFDIGWYLSTNTAITTTDYLVGIDSQSGLSANSYVNKSLSVDLDNVSVLPTTSATYYLGFISDDLNVIPESNENDNSYYFTASAITYPDPIGTVGVVSPNGGENWQVGTSHNITWTSTNITNVKLEYTTNNGSAWNTVIASTPAPTGSYTWTVPNTPSTQCKVRISDASNSSVTDMSNAIFTIQGSGGPGWVPAANQQYNMSVIARLYFDNVLSTNTGDIVAAFVGTECRGIASPGSNGTIFLTVSSNVQTGETIEFKAWKSSTQEIQVVAQTVPFQNMGEIGTLANPFRLDAGVKNLVYNFGAGYTWMSVNVNPGTMGVNTLFMPPVINPSPNDRITGQTSFCVWDGTQWQGSLITIDPKLSYVMKLTTAQACTLQGFPVALTPVSFGAGYTWGGFLPQNAMPINTALANITPAPTPNDRVISQSAFAVWDGSQWLGSLTTLTPGKGYKFKFTNACVLTYPAGVKTEEIKEPEKVVTAPNWVPLPNLQYNMSIIAKVQIENGPPPVYSTNANDILGAFVVVGADTQCRGTASPIGTGLYFLTVGSNVQSGESVIFKYYNQQNDLIKAIPDVITFLNMGEIGTLVAPQIFNGGPVPVELTSFTGTVNKNKITLTWTTSTEKNNKGFEVERKTDKGAFSKISFVEGYGTTTENRSYTFTDKSPASGTNIYRLRQVDYDGSFSYSNEIEVMLELPKEYSLSQNYPNPFNPSTVISYQLPEGNHVSIKVYDMIGNEVATLINEVKEAGYHTVTFNAENISTGVYFYQIRAGEFTSTKKLILMK